MTPGKDDRTGEREGPELWTISAGGYSATVDAFATMSPVGGGNPGAEHDLWFLSMVGPQTSVKAVWATLLNNPPGIAHLTPGAEGLALEGGYRQCRIPYVSQGTWTTKITRMANGMGYHAMVYTHMAEHGFDREDFLLLAQEEGKAPRLHLQFLDRRISLPLHHSWDGWAWERGLEKREIVPLDCLGIHAWRCVPNTALLQRDLGQAIREGMIGVPADAPEGE